jgi:hypothetical protein
MSESASSADVHQECLRLLRTAATAPDYEAAIAAVREAAADVSDETAWRVMIALACESVWRARPRRSRAELVAWIDRRALELAWEAS